MGKHISFSYPVNGEAVPQCGKLVIFGNFQKVFGWSFVSKILDGILY